METERLSIAVSLSGEEEKKIPKLLKNESASSLDSFMLFRGVSVGFKRAVKLSVVSLHYHDKKGK